MIYYKDRWRFDLTAESKIEIGLINVKVRMNLKMSVKILLKYFDTFQLLFPSSLHLKLNVESKLVYLTKDLGVSLGNQSVTFKADRIEVNLFLIVIIMLEEQFLLHSTISHFIMNF